MSFGEYLGGLLYLAALASPVLKLDKFIMGPERKQTAKSEQRWGWQKQMQEQTNLAHRIIVGALGVCFLEVRWSPR